MGHLHTFELYGNIEALSSALRWRRSITKETLDDDAIPPFVAETRRAADTHPPLEIRNVHGAQGWRVFSGRSARRSSRITFGICVAESIERGSTSSGAARISAQHRQNARPRRRRLVDSDKDRHSPRPRPRRHAYDNCG